MSQLDHKPGVHEESLVHRKLRLEDFEPHEAEALLADLDDLIGVDTASLDEEKRLLAISYDATVTCLDYVEELLARHHCDLEHSWWARFKESWYRQIDQNVRDRVAHEPLSCHRLPR